MTVLCAGRPRVGPSVPAGPRSHDIVPLSCAAQFPRPPAKAAWATTRAPCEVTATSLSSVSGMPFTHLSRTQARGIDVLAAGTEPQRERTTVPLCCHGAEREGDFEATLQGGPRVWQRERSQGRSSWSWSGTQGWLRSVPGGTQGRLPCWKRHDRPRGPQREFPDLTSGAQTLRIYCPRLIGAREPGAVVTEQAVVPPKNGGNSVLGGHSGLVSRRLRWASGR